jgi:hypothetical protein
LAISAVLTGFVLGNIAVVARGSWCLRVASAAFLISTVGLWVAALNALLARTPTSRAKKAVESSMANVVYFGHIQARPTAAEYHSDFQRLSEAELLRDLSHQNWELGNIASTKYRHYRIAWRWLFGQIALFVIFLMALAIDRAKIADRPAQAHAAYTRR